MSVVRIDSLSHPGLEVFSRLTEAQLRNKLNPAEGLFIAESPKVIKVALAAGYEAVSLLTEERHLYADAADIVASLPPDVTVFTGPRELLASLTGYTLTRGVLCAMRRKPHPPVDELCRGKRRVVVIDGVVDATNVGAIFRSAAALGMDGVVVTSDSCDPLNRRAVRVSMGSVFLIPWTWIDHPVSSLSSLGFKTVAMALTDNSVTLSDPALLSEPRLAIIMGTEGDGLPAEAIESSDYVVRIPMAYGVDSLNVAAASAVAFYALGVNS